MRLIKTLLILVLLQNATTVLAQDRGSVQLNLNSGTRNYYKNVFSLNWEFFVTPPKVIERESALSISYRINREKNISFGFNMGYDKARYTKTYRSGTVDTKVSTAINAAGEMYIRYSKPNPKRMVYGMVGVGIERYSIEQTENNITSSIKQNHLGFQVTPIGFDYSIYKRWHGLVEMGYGYKGIISIGVRYKF